MVNNVTNPITQDSALVVNTQYSEGDSSTTVTTTQIVVLVVPVGAVTRTAQFSTTVGSPGDAPVVSGQVNNIGFGAPITLTAQDAQGKQVHTFGQPLILQLSYDPAALHGVDPATLTIAFFDPTSGSWVTLPTSVDTVNHLLTALTTHFTMFQVRASLTSTAQVHAILAAQKHLVTHQQVSQSAGAMGLPTLITRVPLLQGVPVVVTLPQVVQIATKPATAHARNGKSPQNNMVRIIGPAHAHVTVTFQKGVAVLGTSSLITDLAIAHATLDAHGYTAVAVPGTIINAQSGILHGQRQSVTVYHGVPVIRLTTRVDATLNGQTVHTSGSILLRFVAPAAQSHSK